jgi:hypothetical protein
VTATGDELLSSQDGTIPPGLQLFEMTTGFYLWWMLYVVAERPRPKTGRPDAIPPAGDKHVARRGEANTCVHTGRGYRRRQRRGCLCPGGATRAALSVVTETSASLGEQQRPGPANGQ